MSSFSSTGHRVDTTTMVKSPQSQRLLRRLIKSMLTLLAALVVLVTAMPVLLLFTTSVPTVIALALALADLGLIIALLRWQHSLAVTGMLLLGLIVVSIVTVWLSQVFASTPAITDAQGQPLPNSIATLEKVTLSDTKQWITIRGEDINNPVLLFLAGGPGGSELAWTRKYLAGLEKHFVVVNWDQPGTGKSYDAVPIVELTPERFVSDAHELTLVLRERFEQEKIYLMGESGGTIWGIMLVQQYPDLFHAWVSAGGQMVNTTENDVLGYEMAIELAAERGDTNTVESLRRNGPPPYTGDGMLLNRYMPYLGLLNGYMHQHAAGDGQEGNRILDIIDAPEYGLIDKVNWFRGLVDVFTQVYPQLEDLEFRNQANKLAIPAYFIQGRWDVNAMSSLVADYYEVLDAPHKELIWFEESGHDPLYEESARFVDVMVNKVLPETLPAQR